MDRETLSAFAQMARAFAQKEVRAMVGQERRDGDLSLLPSLLKKAEETGLMSSPEPEHPGHQYGVWGEASLTEGPTASLVILEEIAKECAGVALCLHAAGMASLEMPNPTLRRPALAFFARDQRFSWGFLKGEEGLTNPSFTVLAPPQWDGVLAIYPSEKGWQSITMAREEVEAEPLTPRTGLAAAEVLQVTVKLEAGEEANSPKALLRRHLLGITAIAVGNAQGAIRAAKEYASQRYQGGGRIKDHSAVRALLGDAVARTEATRGQLYWAAKEDTETEEATIRAMAVAVRGLKETWQATTNALQVLGGYGYMEDYRLEKRLRDAMSLRSLPPSSRDLILMLGDIEEGGAP